MTLGDWFGKGCIEQSCKFEGWDTEDGRYEEDRSSPVLVFCNHPDNEDDSEGNCNKKRCPKRIKRIVQIAFAGNYEVLYDFFTDIDLQVGDPVVCDTARGYSVGKVSGFVDKSTKATNWIVQKVDVDGHKKRLEREELAEMLG